MLVLLGRPDVCLERHPYLKLKTAGSAVGELVHAAEAPSRLQGISSQSIAHELFGMIDGAHYTQRDSGLSISCRDFDQHC
jgi:hypothetical protein